MDTIRIFDAGKYKQFYVEILMDILGLFKSTTHFYKPLQ